MNRFCDKHMPVCVVINIFVAYGWRLHATMEALTLTTNEDTTPQPANIAIFTHTHTHTLKKKKIE